MSTVSPALMRALDNKCAPCRKARARQCGRLSVAIVSGRAREPSRGTHDDFARVAVQAIAGDKGEVSVRGRAVEPEREEARDDMVADGEFGNAVADRLDDARAVGHQNSTVSNGECTDGHRVIVVVERTRVDADLDFARARRRRRLHVREFQSIKSAWSAEFYAFHCRVPELSLVFARTRRVCPACGGDGHGATLQWSEVPVSQTFDQDEIIKRILVAITKRAGEADPAQPVHKRMRRSF